MQDPDDNLNNNGDNSGQLSDQPVPTIPVVDESLPNEPQFEEPIASPAVTGEEDASGDAPDGEPMDIDKQLKSVGRDKNENDQI